MGDCEGEPLGLNEPRGEAVDEGLAVPSATLRVALLLTLIVEDHDEVGHAEEVMEVVRDAVCVTEGEDERVPKTRLGEGVPLEQREPDAVTDTEAVGDSVELALAQELTVEDTLGEKLTESV